MPFIWDDENWRLVDVDDEYDTKKFVVSRKLFIMQNEENSEGMLAYAIPFTEKALHTEFRKYGQIESIELINSKIDENPSALLNTKKVEAYITFAKGENAYLATIDNNIKKSKSKFIVEPADTWIQPPTHSTSRANDPDDPMELTTSCTLLDLNEDCLLQILKFGDLESLVALSQVCRTFRDLLHREKFPKIKKISIIKNKSGFESNQSGFESNQTLATIRKTLQCIGPYVCELEIKWHEREGSLKRLLQKLGQHVGRGVRKLNVCGILFTEELLRPLTPFLNQLHTLEILAYNYDFDLDVDFHALCPNLVKLKLLQSMTFMNCCKPWPSLEHMSVVNNEFMEPETFCSFVKQNPQLKCLKFTAYQCDNKLKAVAKYLLKMEKLTIHQGFPDTSTSNIIYLSSLENLFKLNLMYLEENKLNGILQCLTKFTKLRELKLHLFDYDVDDGAHYEPNYQALTTLGHELHHLEKFQFHYHLTDSVVVDFIRGAESLKEFHMHGCDLIVSEKLIRDIVCARKANRPSPAAGQCVPLKLFVNFNFVSR